MPVNNCQIRDSLFGGVEAYELAYTPHELPKHSHDHYAVGIIKSGKRILVWEGREFFISSGDVILLNPGEKHSCSPLAGGALKFLGLNIARQFFETAFNKKQGQADCRPLFRERVVSDARLASCVCRLHGLFLGRGQESGLSGEARDLFQTLFAWCRAETRIINSREIDAVSLACRHMNARYAETVSLNALCSEAGLSISTLTRCFERQKNISPYCYLTNVRIREAKRFLSLGLSVCDVAMRTGFADQSHFIRCFRKQTGLTPGQYRKNFFAAGGRGDA